METGTHASPVYQHALACSFALALTLFFSLLFLIQACKCTVTAFQTCEGTAVNCLFPNQPGCLSTCTPIVDPSCSGSTSSCASTPSAEGPISTVANKATWTQNGVWKVGSDAVQSCLEDPATPRLSHADGKGLFECMQGGGDCQGKIEEKGGRGRGGNCFTALTFSFSHPLPPPPSPSLRLPLLHFPRVPVRVCAVDLVVPAQRARRVWRLPHRQLAGQLQLCGHRVPVLLERGRHVWRATGEE